MNQKLSKFNQSNREKTLFTLSLYLFLSIEVNPANYETAVDHENAFLPCGKITVLPGDKVTWEKDGVNVLEKFPDRASVDAKGTLYLDPVKRSDIGLYQCIVNTKRFGDEVIVTKTRFAFLTTFLFKSSAYDIQMGHLGTGEDLPQKL